MSGRSLLAGEIEHLLAEVEVGRAGSEESRQASLGQIGGRRGAVHANGTPSRSARPFVDVGGGIATPYGWGDELTDRRFCGLRRPLECPR
jgi:hypothetical protein